MISTIWKKSSSLIIKLSKQKKLIFEHWIFFENIDFLEKIEFFVYFENFELIIKAILINISENISSKFYRLYKVNNKKSICYKKIILSALFR